MAPPASTKKKGKLGFISKKIGPLPAWAWAGILVALVGAYVLFRQRGSGGGTEYGPSIVSGATPNATPSPQDAPYGGYPAGNTPTGQMLSPEVASNLSEGDPGIYGAINDLYSYQQSVDTDMFSQIAGLRSDLDSLVATATLGPPSASAATATNPVTTADVGVKWGDRNFKTKKDLASWLSARGSSYAVWSQRHPEAAKKLTGPAPVARGKSKPQSKPKPSPKPKPRTVRAKTPPKPKTKPKKVVR